MGYIFFLSLSLVTDLYRERKEVLSPMLLNIYYTTSATTLLCSICEIYAAQVGDGRTPAKCCWPRFGCPAPTPSVFVVRSGARLATWAGRQTRAHDRAEHNICTPARLHIYASCTCTQAPPPLASWIRPLIDLPSHFCMLASPPLACALSPVA